MGTDTFNYFMESYYNRSYDRKDYESCLLDFRKNENDITINRLLKELIFIKNTKRITNNFEDESIYKDIFWKKYDNILTMKDLDMAINLFAN